MTTHVFPSSIIGSASNVYDLIDAMWVKLIDIDEKLSPEELAYVMRDQVKPEALTGKDTAMIQAESPLSQQHRWALVRLLRGLMAVDDPVVGVYRPASHGGEADFDLFYSRAGFPWSHNFPAHLLVVLRSAEAIVNS